MNVDVTIITTDIVGDALEVTAIVVGLVESTGSCTLELTNGSLSRVAEVVATAGNDSTYCGILAIPLDALQTGVWRARIAYESPQARGKSSFESVDIP